MSPETKAPRAATQGADGAHASTAPAKTTKARTIAEALISGSLNRFEAERIGDHCLNTTVAELRAKGFPCVAVWEEVPTRFARTVRVKRWWVPTSERTKARRILQAWR